MNVFTVKMKDIVLVSCSKILNVDSCLEMIHTAAKAATHPSDFNICLDCRGTDIELYPQDEIYNAVRRLHGEFMSPAFRYAFRNKIAMILPGPL